MKSPPWLSTLLTRATRTALFAAIVLLTFLTIVPILVWIQSGTDAAQYHSLTTSHTFDNVTVQIVAPATLRLDASAQPQALLTAWLTSTSPLSGPYTLTFTPQEALLWYAADNTPRAPSLQWNSVGPAPAPQSLYPRLLDRADTNDPLILHATLTGPRQTPQTFTLTLPRESAAALRWRTFVRTISLELVNTDFLAGLAGVLVSIFALVVSQRWEEERENRERRAQIAALRAGRNDNTHDALKLVADVLKLDALARTEAWDEAFQSDLARLRADLTRDPEIATRILTAAGAALTHQATAAAEHALDLWGQLLGPPWTAHAAALATALNPHAPAKSPQGENTTDASLTALRAVWDTYDESARDLVIPIVQALGARPLARPALLDWFRHERAARRLLRDARVRTLAPELAVYHYPWPARPAPPPATENADVAHWLSHAGLHFNPFGDSETLPHDVLQKTWTPPEHWDDLRAPHATWSTAHPSDLSYMAAGLTHALESAPHQTANVVHLPLPLSTPPHTLDDCLRALARAYALAWLAILPSAPDAWLDLPPASHSAIAEWLAWALGSRHAVTLRLQNAFATYAETSDTTNRPTVHSAHRMQIALTHSTTPAQARLVQQLNAALNTSAAHATPPAELALTWLALRLPGLTHTYMLCTPRPEASPARAITQATHFWHLRADLQAVGVVLKLATAEPTPQQRAPLQRAPLQRAPLYRAYRAYRAFPATHATPLTWSAARLAALLTYRLRLASNNAYNAFDELFRPAPLQPVALLLAEAAHGSPARLAALARRMVAIKLARAPHDPHFDLSDLDAARAPESEGTDSTPC